jgi:hypothetical protein
MFDDIIFAIGAAVMAADFFVKLRPFFSRSPMESYKSPRPDDPELAR